MTSSQLRIISPTREYSLPVILNWFRFLPSVAALLVALFFSAIGATAKIGVAHQMLLGNPSGATTAPENSLNYLIQRDQYAISYNDATGQANWVSWNLTTSDIGSSGRSDNFYADTSLPSGYKIVQPTDYQGSGYDRGHMCPSGDRTVSVADNNVTFFMSNMIPQTASNNQGVWANFEVYCRTLASQGNEVLITCGPSFFGGSRVPTGAAAIPGFTWKIAVVVPPGAGTALERITTSTRVIAIKVPNTANVNSAWQTYLTTVAQLQQDTGFAFFTSLPANVASVLRATIDGQPVEGIPVVTSQPIAQTAAVGGAASFTVAATGNAPLTYQWYFNGDEIPDATGPNLSLSGLGINAMGAYFATVSNSVGIITSASANLVVTGVAPSVVSDPVSKTVPAGSDVVLTVVAAGSPTISYQWRKGGVAIQNAIYSILSVPNVQASDAGIYDVVITNANGNVTSAAATVSVTPTVPSITIQPVDRTVGPNGTTSFTVTAIGTQPIAYQWRKGGANITGNASSTNATLVLTNVTEALAGGYDVVVTNSVGSTISNTVTLAVSTFADGAINITGGTYTQNFDTLPATHLQELTLSGAGPHAFDAAPLNASAMQGWSLFKTGGGGASALFKVDNGSNFVSGAIYSHGTSGSTERALGSLASGTTESAFGVKFVNSTGQTLTQFSVSFAAELWRRGNSAGDLLSFAYSIGGAALNNGTFVAVPTLDVINPRPDAPATSGADGNASENRQTVSATVTGIIWPAGSSLVLRWTDTNNVGSDDGLAMDDFSFTVPAATGPIAPAVLTTTPTNGATGLATSTTIEVTFNQPVNLASGWFSIISAATGPLAATVNGGPNTFTLATPVVFPVDDTITLTVFAAKITDQATGSLPMANDLVLSFTTAAPQPPAIVTQPVSQSVAANNSVAFSVSATGTAPLSFQWRKNEVPINDNVTATGSTLSLFDVQAGAAGSYDVVITNTAGSVTSGAATLTVTPAVTNVIRWNFTSATPSGGLPTGVTGGTVTVGSNNGTTTMLQSASISSGYAGATGNNNAAAAAFTGSFNAASSTYFQFTLEAGAQQRFVASAINFGSRSTGTGPTAYAVYTNQDGYGVPIASGALQNNGVWTLIIPSMSTVSSSVGGAVTFRVYGYNGSGSAAAGSANWRIDDLALTVITQTAPSITLQPASKTVNVGVTVNLSVSAQGSVNIAYQWRKNGVAIEGNATATTDTLTIPNVQLVAAGNYDVVVTNPVASITSDLAVLTVTSPATGFDSWRAIYFSESELGNSTISGPLAILTADGLTNTLKYALGLDPRAIAANLPEAAVSGTDMVYTYSRPVDRNDIGYSVQVSSDLATWSIEGVTHEHVSTTAGTSIWRAVYPMPPSGRLFFRLRAELLSN